MRLSGKLSEDWRLGFLNIQTDEDISNEIASNNNSMLALQKKVFDRSNISMFFINRQSFKEYDFIDREDEYNRVLGLDYNLASKDGRWTGKFYGHKSFQPDDSEGNLSTGAFLGRTTKFFNFFADAVYIDEDFSSDLGFIRRTDIVKLATSVEKVFWPKSEVVNSYGLNLFPIVTWRPGLDYQKTDHDVMLTGEVGFKNQSQLSLGFVNSYAFLTEEFDPTRTDGVPLPGNTGYHYNNLSLSYMSNRANMLAIMGESTIGRFFNGNIFSLDAQLFLRILPVSYTHLTLPTTPYV